MRSAGVSVPGVRPKPSSATELLGLPVPPNRVPSCLLCPSHAQAPCNRPPLSKWVLSTAAQATSVGTEKVTERDCLQLIDLFELLTEGCAQSPLKIRGGGCSRQRALGQTERCGEGDPPWLFRLACSRLSVGLCEFPPRRRERDKQEGKKGQREGRRERSTQQETDMKTDSQHLKVFEHLLCTRSKFSLKEADKKKAM